MSYTVYLADPKTGEEVSSEYHNYTWNIRPILQHVWDGGEINDLQGRLAIRVSQLIATALDLIEKDKEKLKLLEPVNRWGTVEGCSRWLAAIKKECDRNPYAIVRVV